MNEWLEAVGLEVTEVRDVVPQSGAQDKLTVTLWLARDQRVLMAENLPKQNQELVV